MVEGVMANGTRTTITIPAGQMGNEQPWQTVVETGALAGITGGRVPTNVNDPRTGETDYALYQHQPHRAGPRDVRSPGRFQAERFRHSRPRHRGQNVHSWPKLNFPTTWPMGLGVHFTPSDPQPTDTKRLSGEPAPPSWQASARGRTSGPSAFRK